eukprot:149445_1
MRFQFPLALSLLSEPAMAFQTTPRAPALTTRSHHVSTTKLSNNEPQGNQIIMVQCDTEKKPKRRRNILSKLTVKQLSALTTLKKDERNTFNKQRLVKLGLTLTTAFLATFSESSIARAAATPLLVTKGSVAPLLFSAPGVGIVVMPGMRGIFPYEVGRLPNKGAMFFALALFVATA